MKKKTILVRLLALLLLAPFTGRADEGMWLPLLLKQLNESDMQKRGLKLSAEDIYSINKTSLKDAIVLFGGGCTGEMISGEGLLLTNHHCGYSQIQSHSSVKQDYLTDGFWAKNRSEELPNPGLTATFIVRMEDVTAQVLKDIPANLPEAEREKKVQANMAGIEKAAVEGTHYKAQIKPYFYGNEYYMFVTETFTDVRLVGAPPSSIGKFGGDTDNWMWPRHTGDFSVFRVYAGPDNKPAGYSAENKPYVPKHFLPISLKPIKESDFTMVFGFPGRTTEYLPSYAVKEIYEVSNPAKIAIRETKLNILDQHMKASDEVRIQYAAKYASISNYHKKWIGENRGLKKLNAVEKKQELEKQFTAWVNASPERKAKYGTVLSEFEKNYNSLNGITLSRDYFIEAALGVELISYAQNYVALVDLIKNKAPQADIEKQLKNLGNYAGFFKNYNQAADKEVFAALMQMYYQNVEPKFQPEYFRTTVEKKYKGNFRNFANDVYAKSFMVSADKVKNALPKISTTNTKLIEKDPAYLLARAFLDNYRAKIMLTYVAASDANTLNNRLFVAGLREMQTDKKFYPDANSTLRVAYGQVSGYEPMDGARYKYYTTLEGIMEKADPSNPDFVVPQKLVDLYKAKDYGDYGVNGEMPVAFIATNHTTGGNSGSPVINANGELMGTNFDRAWESTMSDIMYDPDRVRNIIVSTNYMLFIIDKFAGATHLIKEMNIVREVTPLPMLENDVDPQPEMKIEKSEKKKDKKVKKKTKLKAA
ncbi:S46 family peptidase [Adhaeribacter sp. BT258]|uniref:Dipeptidyl-peptidase n=1 Tax=Adhaeribacter terrigena TaxID=2793070 RepID=A0ABS1C1R1_9BACT|nr:S46 family peptidase [Adhaeribacter terrigena]MBK0403116.1 S46 family peptidase [Adhaeribacter terrigena]